MLELRKRIGIPGDLAQIGIDDGRTREIGEMAVADPSAATNPIPFDAATYGEIATRAVKGILD